MVLRQSIDQARYWEPWKQALLVVSLIVVGLALIALSGDVDRGPPGRRRRPADQANH